MYMPGVYYTIHAFEHLSGKLLFPQAESNTALNDAGWKLLADGENVVNSSHDVLYRVTMFKETVAGVQNPAVDTVLTDGGNVLRPSIAGGSSSATTDRFVVWKESAAFKKVARVGLTITFPATIYDGYYIRTIHDRFFDFTIVPQGVSGALPKPDFKAQVRLMDNSYIDTVAAEGQYIEVKQRTGDITPTIVFTKVTAPQTVPSSVTEFDGRPQSQPWVWDACNKQYARYWEEPDSKWATAHPMDTDIKYFVFIKYFDSKGKLIKKDPIGVKSEYSIDQYKKTSISYKAKGILATIQQKAKNCGDPNATNNGSGADVPVVPFVPVAVTDVLFNPPPHSVTRHFSPIADEGR